MLVAGAALLAPTTMWAAASRADSAEALPAMRLSKIQFDPPGDEIERFYYGFSIFHCLPVGMADSPSAGTGTVMRPATLRAYAAEAGFSTVDVLPIEHDLFRFYRLEA